MQNVYSFLMLKEAIMLRGTCQQLIRDGNNVFRYSCMVDGGQTKKQHRGFELQNDREKYLHIQKRTVLHAIMIDLDNLRALLANESVHGGLPLLQDLLDNFIQLSTTDNEEAVSILLKDGRPRVNPHCLDVAAKKDFTLMVEALQENETIKASIQMCATCKVNKSIGVYTCANLYACKSLAKSDQRPWGNMDALGENVKPSRHCRSYFLRNNQTCMQCDFFVCPECIRHGSIHQCQECRAITCLDSEDSCCIEYMNTCSACRRKMCDSCARDVGWECNSCKAQIVKAFV